MPVVKGGFAKGLQEASKPAPRIPTNEEQLEAAKATHGWLTEMAEHFLEANRVCLEILGDLISEVQRSHGQESMRLTKRLEVIEDILEGANTRYTGG